MQSEVSALNRRICRLALLSAALLLGVQAHAATCRGPQALEAKLKSHPDSATWVALGNYYGEHNQFDCAATAFRSAVRLSPKSAQVNYLLGLALFQSDHEDQAIQPLRKSLALDSSPLKPHLLLGYAYSHLHHLPEAEEQWRAALRIDPASDVARHELSRTLVGEQKYGEEIQYLRDQKLDDPLAIDLSIAYAAAGDLNDAIAVIRKAMETSDSVPLSTNLVALYVKAERDDEAEKAAQKAYAAHPDDFTAQITYMKTLVVNGDWGPAQPLGKKLLEEKPHDFDVLYTNGVLERQQGQYEAARDHLREAATSRRQMANLNYNLGVALARLHDTPGAIEQLRSAIALGDKDPEAHFELANALRAAGQTDEARQEMLRYQQVVRDQQNRTLAVSKASEADADLEKGDLQAAIALYREAVQAFPKDTMIGYKLALALDKANQTDDERAALQQVITTDPTFAAAQYQLGYLDSRAGNNAAAEEHFRYAVQAAPAYVDAWISLAATLGMESKLPEAQQAVRIALRIDPKNSQAQELSHELGQPAQKQQSQN
jgi:tetratricopeptide (TPR) repeat protein